MARAKNKKKDRKRGVVYKVAVVSSRKHVVQIGLEGVLVAVEIALQVGLDLGEGCIHVMGRVEVVWRRGGLVGNIALPVEVGLYGIDQLE